MDIFAILRHYLNFVHYYQPRARYQLLDHASSHATTQLRKMDFQRNLRHKVKSVQYTTWRPNYTTSTLPQMPAAARRMKEEMKINHLGLRSLRSLHPRLF